MRLVRIPVLVDSYVCPAEFGTIGYDHQARQTDPVGIAQKQRGDKRIADALGELMTRSRG